jgi:hypothetical protein
MNDYGLLTSQLIFGCMGLGGGWNRDAIQTEHIKEAHEAVNIPKLESNTAIKICNHFFIPSVINNL